MTATKALVGVAAVLLGACAARRAGPPSPSLSGPHDAAPEGLARPAAPGTDAAAPARLVPQPPATETCAAYPRTGAVRRSAVLGAVEAGFGRWLSGVDVDRRIERGRFRGWIIRRLYPADPCYRALDLRPGDVVTRVNGRVPERPEHASDIFLGLRSAPAITVDYLRDGQSRSLTLAIVPE